MEQPIEAGGKKDHGSCGCQYHDHCAMHMHGHCHCGFWKGLILGMVLVALLVFLCDRICDHRIEPGYYNSPSMTQNAEPDNHMRSR